MSVTITGNEVLLVGITGQLSASRHNQETPIVLNLVGNATRGLQTIRNLAVR